MPPKSQSPKPEDHLSSPERPSEAQGSEQHRPKVHAPEIQPSEVNVEIDDGKYAPIDRIDRDKLEGIIARAPERTESTLQELCRFLKENSDRLCTEEKAWLVYRWLGLNIDYDVEGLHSGARVDVSPEGAFRNGKTVCSGYSGLYKSIADTLGIEIVCINGYAKGVGYDPEVSFASTNHEWNAVKIDGKWFLLDATWGGGCQMGGKHVRRYSPYYFGPDPKRLIRSHFPSDPQWQFLEKPVTKEEFEKLLMYQDNFYNCGLLSTDVDVAVISRNESAAFTIRYDPKIDMQMMASLEYQEGKKYTEVDKSWFIQKFDDHFKAEVLLNKKGKYSATFFVKLAHETVYHSAFRHIISSDKDSRECREFPMIYEQFSKAKAILYEPMTGPLKKGTTVYFKVQVEEAEIVMVETKTQVNLSKDGNIFSGRVEVNSDTVIVYCKLPGISDYHGLLNYPAN